MIGALLLSACARPAPPLPTTTGLPTLSHDPARCTWLGHEITQARVEMAEIEEVMAGRRPRDQITAYLASVLYPPLLASIDQQRARKKALDARQTAIDAAIVEQRRRSCPAAD